MEYLHPPNVVMVADDTVKGLQSDNAGLPSPLSSVPNSPGNNSAAYVTESDDEDDHSNTRETPSAEPASLPSLLEPAEAPFDEAVADEDIDTPPLEEDEEEQQVAHVGSAPSLLGEEGVGPERQLTSSIPKLTPVAYPFEEKKSEQTTAMGTGSIEGGSEIQGAARTKNAVVEYSSFRPIESTITNAQATAEYTKETMPLTNMEQKDSNLVLFDSNYAQPSEFVNEDYEETDDEEETPYFTSTVNETVPLATHTFIRRDDTNGTTRGASVDGTDLKTVKASNRSPVRSSRTVSKKTYVPIDEDRRALENDIDAIKLTRALKTAEEEVEEMTERVLQLRQQRNMSQERSAEEATIGNELEGEPPSLTPRKAGYSQDSSSITNNSPESYYYDGSAVGSSSRSDSGYEGSPADSRTTREASFESYDDDYCLSRDLSREYFGGAKEDQANITSSEDDEVILGAASHGASAGSYAAAIAVTLPSTRDSPVNEDEDVGDSVVQGSKSTDRNTHSEDWRKDAHKSDDSRVFAPAAATSRTGPSVVERARQIISRSNSFCSDAPESVITIGKYDTPTRHYRAGDYKKLLGRDDDQKSTTSAALGDKSTVSKARENSDEAGRPDVPLPPSVRRVEQTFNLPVVTNQGPMNKEQAKTDVSYGIASSHSHNLDGRTDNPPPLEADPSLNTTRSSDSAMIEINNSKEFPKLMHPQDPQEYCQRNGVVMHETVHEDTDDFASSLSQRLQSLEQQQPQKKATHFRHRSYPTPSSLPMVQPSFSASSIGGVSEATKHDRVFSNVSSPLQSPPIQQYSKFSDNRDGRNINAKPEYDPSISSCDTGMLDRQRSAVPVTPDWAKAKSKEGSPLQKLSPSILSGDSKPVLVHPVDDENGIPKGDIMLSLLSDNSMKSQTDAQETWSHRVREAIWRCRSMRRLLVGGIAPTAVPEKKASLPVDVDHVRVVGGIRNVSTIQQNALDHLKRNEFEESLELFEDIVFNYYAFFEQVLAKRDQFSSQDLAQELSNFKPYIGACLHNIGIVHLLKGDYEDAYSFFKRAAENRRSCLGEGHPDHVTSVVRAAVARFASDNFSDAHANLELALALAGSKARTTSDYAQLGEILNNLGCLSYMCGQPSQAMQLFSESLDVQFAVVNSTLYGDRPFATQTASLNISITRGNIGFLALVLKDVNSGIQALEAALRDQRMLLSNAHATVISTMDHLAVANLLDGREQKALKMLRRIYQAQVDAYGPKDKRCIATQQKMVTIRMSKKKNTEEVVGLEGPSSTPKTTQSKSKGKFLKGFLSLGKKKAMAPPC